MNKWVHNKYFREHDWVIEGVDIVFKTLLQMKNYLGLSTEDTVFDYARRHDLKIYSKDNDGVMQIEFHAKNSIGV